jgi:hypothetical protein
MSRRIRPLIAMALAVIVVAGLVAADVVTLHKAKPSFDHETQAFNRLLVSPTTTVPTKTVPASTTGNGPTPSAGNAPNTTSSTDSPGSGPPGSVSSP